MRPAAGSGTGSTAGSATVMVERWRWEKGRGAVRSEDLVAREEPLEIRVRGRSIAVIMRTPGEDEELAAGFLLTEGLISRREELVEIGPCLEGEAGIHGNVVNVFLAPGVEVDWERLTRHSPAGSSCGLCGKASIETVHQQFEPLAGGGRIPADFFIGMSERVREAQAVFSQTGGLHAAAVFDSAGRLVVVREDIGRHNAVDKVIGNCFLGGRWPLEGHVLFVSGRASFEIMQKALCARIGFVAAVSAPSSLAVEFAEESGQTLVGFLRGSGLNIYSHPEQIQEPAG